ncbi:MAG: acetate--CoA ligase family protein [Candidatus Aenigmarchaeota archaeon]|nr:acetate--CoA ligase family protein [Candidatus Aenigmarchaeota archaeon]
MDKIKKMVDNEAYRLLEKYKIPIAKYNFVKKSKNFEKDIEKHIKDYPCVVKIDGDVIHKKKAGCVEIVYKKDELKKKVSSIVKNSKKFKVNGAIIQDFVVGKEVMIGSKRDQQFGTILMFGSGGVMADVIKDVSFRVLPVDENELEFMIKETKAYQVFMEGENVDEFVDVLKKVSKLMTDNVEIKELDINPFFLNQKICAGDIRIILR